MVLKIDLEKACARFSWSFIRDTLPEVCFNHIWLHNIMSCIETPCMSVLWNRELIEWFGPSQEIRQGNVISKYLFVLCMDVLAT